MKTRNGFVSNSSSSSFVIVADQIKISELTTKHIGEKTYVCGSADSGEGANVFILANKDMLKYVKDHPFQFFHAYINSKVLVGQDEYKAIDASDVGKKVYAFERSQHSAGTLAELEEWCSWQN